MRNDQLTARAVATARPPSGETDSGRPVKQRTLKDHEVPGLELRVARSGRKSWSVRYRVRGMNRQRRKTIGVYPAMGLADARGAARAIIGKAAAGGDPVREDVERLHEEKRRDADTVEAVAALYLDRHALGPDVGPRNGDGRIDDVWTFEPETGTPRKRTWGEDRRKLEVEILPKWGSRPITEISRRDVRELVETVAHRGAPTSANRLRALLSKLFSFALERDMVDANPVLATSRPGDEEPRDRVLSDDEIRQLWTVTEGMESAQTGAFFRLLLLTGQRRGEIRNMQWSEIDFNNEVWTIPASRAKNKKSHRVPLSDAVLDILTDLPMFDSYVLAGARGNRQFYAAAATIGLDDFQPARDLRSTAATRMASAGVPQLHVGRVLNHSDKSVTARHYNRASYDDEKRVALDTLARVVMAVLKNEKAKVLPISKGA